MVSPTSILTHSFQYFFALFSPMLFAQIHGAAGVSQDFFLAYAYAQARTLRIADGPDEVHILALAKAELRNQQRLHAAKL